MRQVSRQVRHHIAADQLPPEVIVLALAVLALVRVAVLLEGAAGCGESDPSAPAEQLVPPQNPARMVHSPHTHTPKHRGTPGIPPRAPVRKDVVLPAANPPSLPFSSPTSETSWQVSAPGKSRPQEQDAAPSFPSWGPVTKLGGFSQDTGTRPQRSHKDLQDPEGSCKRILL